MTLLTFRQPIAVWVTETERGMTYVSVIVDTIGIGGLKGAPGHIQYYMLSSMKFLFTYSSQLTEFEIRRCRGKEIPKHYI